MRSSAPDSLAEHDQQAPASSRRHPGAAPLILTELNPRQVVDCFDNDAQPLELLTFGMVREACPKCAQRTLKLILRQSSVRMAHLFCPDCASCYDACYADGAPALTI